MKQLFALIISTLLTTSVIAEYTKECGDSYGNLKRNSNQKFISMKTVINERDLNLLAPMESKALEEYHKNIHLNYDDVEYQITTYKYSDKRRRNQINGYEVKIDEVGSDEDVIRYYFDNQAKMLRWSWENQTPVKEWVCEGYKNATTDYIRTLAREAGEYFDYLETSYKDDIKIIVPDELPSKVLEIAKEITKQRAIDNQDANGNGGAGLSDRQYQIYKDGKLIGFVIRIYDYIDHPLWDGSGVFIFIKSENKTIVTKREWSA